MPVQQYAIIVAAAIAGGDVDENQRRAAIKTHHFYLHPRDGLRFGPGFQQRHSAIHMPVLHPIGIEHRRFIGNFDVFDQLRDDFSIPFGGHEVADLVAVEMAGVHGVPELCGDDCSNCNAGM